MNKLTQSLVMVLLILKGAKYSGKAADEAKG